MRSPSCQAPIWAALAALWLATGPGLPAPAGEAGREAGGRSPYVSREWQVDDGLLGSHIEAIGRSEDGYLWVGSYAEGPVRFDGVAFTPLRAISPAYAARFRRDDPTTVLLGASGGGLWIGSKSGGLIRLRVDGGITAYSTAQGLPDDGVRAVREGRDGTLWVGTQAGLCRIRGGAVEPEDGPGGPGKACVTALWEDPDGTLWVGTKGRGLFRRAGGRWASFGRATGESLLAVDVSALLRDRLGRLWVGADDGLYRLEGGRFRRFNPEDGLGHPTVLSLAEDRRGTLWAGTVRGASTLRPDDTFAPVSAGVGVSSRYVFALLPDREGGLWAATGFGLHRLRPREVEVLGAEEGLSDSLVSTVGPARDGSLWVATGSGLDRIGRDGVPRPVAVEGLPALGLTAVHEGLDGDLWVGTWGSGLFRVGSGRVKATYNEVDGLGSAVIRSVLQARDGTVWVGTWGGGLARIRDGRASRVTTGDGPGSDRVRALLEDRSGRIWAGTAAGLTRIGGGPTRTFTARDGLANDSVFCLHEDGRGVLWIGTSGGGLVRFEGGRFAAFTTRDGLCSDTITQILEDDAGDLWLGSTRGIFRVRKRQLRDYEAGRVDALSCPSYARNEGMRAGQCSGGSQPAGCRGVDGRLWFPTLDGLAVVDPSRARPGGFPPPTKVEAVLVDGRPAVAGRAPAPGRGELEFRYTACSFEDPEKVRFRYQLVGVDPDWVDAGTRRAAFYANVPPGQYRFRVRASNDDGHWDVVGASAEVSLPPHYYQTASFRVACLSAGLLLAGAASRRRLAASRAREAELVRLVAARTAELEAAKAELESRNERLSELAATDGLTGLRNRRHFLGSLGAQLMMAASRGRPTSMLILDVDHFKAYNDAFGHPAGDEALRAVARVLLGSGREGDLAARYGGEEFVVLLPDTGAADAALVAERLRGRIEAADWPRRPVTASFGVATADDPTAGPEALVAAADLALYRAKRSGRNRVEHAEVRDPVPPPVDAPRPARSRVAIALNPGR